MSNTEINRIQKIMDGTIDGVKTSVNHIESRLNAGWCVVSFECGNLIPWFENEIYPDDTLHNDDFEIIGVLDPLYLYRKTDQMKEFFNDVPDFDSMLTIEVVCGDDNRTTMHFGGYFEGEKEVAMKVLMTNILKMIQARFDGIVTLCNAER